MYALECTQYLASHMDSAHKQDPALLTLATSRGIEFVNILLELGYNYDESYLHNDPGILLKYYTTVGVTKKNYEASCGEFSDLILCTFGGAQILKEQLNISLLNALLLRMGKCRKLFVGSTKEHVETFYDDIENATAKVLHYRPQLANEFTEEMMHTYMNIARTKFSNPDSNKWESVCFIRMMRFLISKKCNLTVRVVALIQQLFATVSDISFASQPNMNVTIEKCKLFDAFLSVQEVADKLIPWDVGRKEGSNFSKTVATHGLPYYTRTVAILYKHGMDIYDLQGKPFRQFNLIGRKTPTHFQSTVLDFVSSIRTDHSWTQRVVLLMATIVLLTGQRVDFERESKNIEGFKRMIEELAGLLGMEGNIRTWRHYRPSRSYITEAAITRATLQILKIFMFYMPQELRLVTLNTIHSRPKTANISGHLQLIIGEIIGQELIPLTQDSSLKELCFFSIRNSLFRSEKIPIRFDDSKNPFNLLPTSENDNYQPTGEKLIFSRSGDVIKTHSDVFELLTMEGLYIYGPSLMETKIECLNLPTSLKHYILGVQEMEWTLTCIMKLFDRIHS